MEREVIYCTRCGTEVSQSDKVCPKCGSDVFAMKFVSDEHTPGQMPVYIQPDKAAEQTQMPENVMAGIAGALLFSLAGVALYVGIYQIGFIAGICSFVMFSLGSLGYGIFSGNRRSSSAASIIIPLIIMLVMTCVAEYLALALAVYLEYKDYGVSFSDVMDAMPELIKDPEVLPEVLKDLGFALLFGLLATIGTVSTKMKAKKAAKQAAEQAAVQEKADGSGFGQV